MKHVEYASYTVDMVALVTFPYELLGANVQQ